MKSLLLLLILTSGYLGYQWNDTRQQLAAAQAKLAQRVSTASAAPASSWIQEKIRSRKSDLEKGAYNQKTNVARSPDIYYTGE